MEYLLDTHTLVWYIKGERNLPKAIREIIENPLNTIYYSTINLWEIIIKTERERIIDYDNINDLNIDFVEAGFIPLSFFPRHIYALEQIIKNNKNIKHKDPFDRALLSQAKENKIYLLTHDDLFKNYKEKYIKIY